MRLVWSIRKGRVTVLRRIKMRADQIRELQKQITSAYSLEDAQRANCWVFHEIAAQLAELNENFRQIIGHEKAYSGGYVGGLRLIRDF
jgi:hypothetical protein